MELNCFSSCLLFIASLQVVASSFFSCYSSKGLFYGLNRQLQECRSLNYVPTLRGLRKKGGTVDGSRLVGLLDTYCKQVDKVDSCVMDFMSISPCREEQEKSYKVMIKQTNYICEDVPKRAIKAKMATLPLMTINPRDSCYLEAARASYTCKRRFYRPGMSNRQALREQLVASMPCTYEILKRKCSPNDKAKFYTLLNYDWLLLPPALGVNVTETFYHI